MLLVLPITLAISLSITVLASTFPVRRATQIEPAVVLRGE
jgi:putative ABC transport system permease protein